MKLQSILEHAERPKIKVEFCVNSTEMANHMVEFLEKLASYTAMGCSRSVGVLDDSDAKDIKVFIDGDGPDRISDVKIVPQKN